MDQYLVDKLKCPHCPKGALTALGADALVCAVCGRVYPVQDGVPDLLPDSGKSAVAPLTPAPAGA